MFDPLAGVSLPRGSMRATGHVVRIESGVRLDAVEIHMGGSSLWAKGILGDPPELAGTDLEVRAEGVSLGPFEGLAGMELPHEAFQLGGQQAARTAPVRVVVEDREFARCKVVSESDGFAMRHCQNIEGGFFLCGES